MSEDAEHKSRRTRRQCRDCTALYDLYNPVANASTIQERRHLLYQATQLRPIEVDRREQTVVRTDLKKSKLYRPRKSSNAAKLSSSLNTLVLIWLERLQQIVVYGSIKFQTSLLGDGGLQIWQPGPACRKVCPSMQVQVSSFTLIVLFRLSIDLNFAI